MRIIDSCKGLDTVVNLLMWCQNVKFCKGRTWILSRRKLQIGEWCKWTWESHVGVISVNFLLRSLLEPVFKSSRKRVKVHVVCHLLETGFSNSEFLSLLLYYLLHNSLLRQVGCLLGNARGYFCLEGTLRQLFVLVCYWMVSWESFKAVVVCLMA